MIDKDAEELDIIATQEMAIFLALSALEVSYYEYLRNNLCYRGPSLIVKSVS